METGLTLPCVGQLPDNEMIQQKAAYVIAQTNVYFKREKISYNQASLLNVRGCKQSACRETRGPLTSPGLLALTGTVW